MIPVPTHPLAHYAFDALAWMAGAGTGLALHRWRLRDAALKVAGVASGGYFAALAIGAVGGAWLAGSLNTLASTIPALSHSVAGALGGAIVGVEFYKAVKGIRGSTGGVFTGPFAAGIVVGRLGCFFAGLPDRTYGSPTALPWAVDIGDHIGRHPVQLYESAAMLAFLAVYLSGLRTRAPWALRRSFYALCTWYGAQRFAWEFLKPYPTVLGPFNLFHLISAGLILYGAIAYGRDLRRQRGGDGGGGPQVGALSVPRPDHEPV